MKRRKTCGEKKKTEVKRGKTSGQTKNKNQW